MAGNGSTPQLNADTKTWYDARSIYRLQQQKAFGAAVTPSDPSDADAAADDCIPAIRSKKCTTANDAFVPLPDDSPEYKPGSWPLSASLYAAIADGFSQQKSVSATIPLQLQANALEGYRKVLLHKKWRRCHHLVAMSANLDNEPRAEDELQQLLLGQQVGNGAKP